MAGRDLPSSHTLCIVHMSMNSGLEYIDPRVVWDLSDSFLPNAVNLNDVSAHVSHHSQQAAQPRSKLKVSIPMVPKGH